MRIPIDPRARTGLLIFLCLAGIFALTSQTVLFLVAVLLAACQLAFFRDPVRAIASGEGPVSPADGVVADITECYEDRFLKEDAVRVGICLSIFNAHVNRSPIAGTVQFQKYEPGKFLNAFSPECSKQNESNWIGVASQQNSALIRQISGAIARKIFWDVKIGQGLERGDKVGIICYGSRTEFFAPKRLFKTSVRPGDKVKAGQTVLGEWLK